MVKAALKLFGKIAEGDLKAEVETVIQVRLLSVLSLRGLFSGSPGLSAHARTLRSSVGKLMELAAEGGIDTAFSSVFSGR